MAKYIVAVSISTWVDMEVEANSEDEARMIALENADPTVPDDWDYQVESVCRDWNDYWDEVEENEE